MGLCNLNLFCGVNAYLYKKKIFRVNIIFCIFIIFWRIFSPNFLACFVAQENQHLNCLPIPYYSPILSLFGSKYIPGTWDFFYSFLTWCSFETIQGSHVGNRPSPVEQYPPAKSTTLQPNFFFIDIASKLPQCNI